MDITNEDILTKVMMDICSDVIEKVSWKILADLQLQILNDTYLSHESNKMYEMPSRKPSGEFIRAFKWNEIKKSVKEITTNLFYDWKSMTINPATYRHIDYVTKEDSRERLAEILNIDGLDDGVGSGNPIARERKAYWDNFLDLEFGGRIDSYFNFEFSKYGIRR